jgi:hypothetical protein
VIDCGKLRRVALVVTKSMVAAELISFTLTFILNTYTLDRIPHDGCDTTAYELVRLKAVLSV